MKKFSLALALFVFSAGCALAQDATPAAKPATAQAPVCDGTPVMVRISEVKPGMMAQFLEAAKMHEAWYRSKGSMTNHIVEARVVERDEATKTYKLSETSVISYHINPPTTEYAHDDAYSAFVKQYQATSTVKSSYQTCMPKVPGM